MTVDIDIAVAPDPENSARWIAALAGLPDGASKTLSGESDPFEGDYLHAIRLNDEFTIDIMPLLKTYENLTGLYTPSLPLP